MVRGLRFGDCMARTFSVRLSALLIFRRGQLETENASQVLERLQFSYGCAAGQLIEDAERGGSIQIVAERFRESLT